MLQHSGIPIPLIAEVVNPAGASSDESLFVPEPESDSSSALEDDLESIDEGEKQECNYVKKFKQTYDNGKMFAPTELDDLRKRELVLIERNETGYYCCKIKHAQLYKDVSLVFQPYITKPMLSQLKYK